MFLLLKFVITDKFVKHLLTQVLTHLKYVATLPCVIIWFPVLRKCCCFSDQSRLSCFWL